MAWWSRWGRKTSGGLGDSLALLKEIFGGPPSKAGPEVSWRTALGVTTVLRCVKVRSNGIAQVPFKVFRERPGGGADVAKDHWAHRVLSRRPNEHQTSFEFRQQMGLHPSLCGNWFAIKVAVGDRIEDLLPIEPGRWSRRKVGPGKWIYIVDLDGQKIELDQKDVWHIRDLSWDGRIGLEPVKLVRDAIGLGLAMDEHVSKTMANGAKLSGLLKHPGKLGDDARKNIKESWAEVYGGSGNAGKTALLEEGMDWVQIQMSLLDAQMLEERKFQIEEICRGFDVFPLLAFQSDKTATFASTEQFLLAHVIHGLQPLHVMIEQSADKWILGDAEDLSAKFIVQGLMRGDHKSRAQFYSRGILDGWMTRNEARALEDMNPLDGLDEPLRPLNMGRGSEPPPDENTSDGTKRGEDRDAAA